MNSRKILIPILACAGLVLVDQGLKWVILRAYALRSVTTVIPGFLSIHPNYNTGMAFGLFQNGTAVLAFVSFVAMIVLSVLVLRDVRSHARLTLNGWALTVILAGDIGNLIDRAFRSQGVVDFIYVHIGPVSDPLWAWFPFNIADSCICIGIGLYLLQHFRGPRKEAEKPSSSI